MKDGVPKKLRDEIEQFLQASVLNSDKKIKFKKWRGPDEALKDIKNGQKAFSRKKPK